MKRISFEIRVQRLAIPPLACVVCGELSSRPFVSAIVNDAGVLLQDREDEIFALCPPCEVAARVDGWHSYLYHPPYQRN